MTYLCSRSFRLVYATVSIRPNSLANLRQHWQDPSFFTPGIPIRPFQVDIPDIYRRLYTDVGHPYGGFPDHGYLDPDLGYLNPCRPYRPQAPYQFFGTQNGNFGLTPLGYSALGPPGYDRYRQHYSSFLYHATNKEGLIPLPVTSSSGSLYVALGSGQFSAPDTYEAV